MYSDYLQEGLPLDQADYFSGYGAGMTTLTPPPTGAVTPGKPHALSGYGQNGQTLGMMSVAVGAVRAGLGVWLLTRMASGRKWPVWVQWVGAGWITLIGVSEIAGGLAASKLATPPAEPPLDPNMMV